MEVKNNALQRVLIVDDSPPSIRILVEELRDKCEIQVATSGADAIRYTEAETLPDLVLLDVMMPGMDGFEVCRLLKSNPRTQNIPIIFITAKNAEEDETRGFEVGAVDYISKPFSLPVVRARVQTHLDLKRKTDFLSSLSTIDGLTGIHNRRHFDQCFDTEWKRACRVQTPLALLMIDIDFFKSFNDHHGHLAGDQCLKQVAAALSSAMKRSADCVFRYGGEEFAAILPQTDARGAEVVADAMSQAIERLNIPHPHSSVSPRVTVSIGGASVVPSTANSSSQLIERADQQLYAAKESGRNRREVVSISDF